MVVEKNESITDLQTHLEDNINALKTKQKDTLKNLVSDFQADMRTVDSEVSRKVARLTEENHQLRLKNDQNKKQLLETRKLLNLAVASDNRKDALIEETKI